MTSALEKAARAVATTASEWGRGAATPDYTVAVARAVLMAVRMVDFDALTPGRYWPPSAPKDFTAMIDAILAEPPYT